MGKETWLHAEEMTMIKVQEAEENSRKQAEEIAKLKVELKDKKEGRRKRKAPPAPTASMARPNTPAPPAPPDQAKYIAKKDAESGKF